MTTASEREAALRRALLSAAEYIEPAPGGLERIQQRLGRPRPLLVAWLGAAWTVVQMRAPDAIEAIRRRAAKVVRLVWDRFGPKSEPGRGLQPLSWIRPLAAMSVAVFVIGAGIYVGLASPASIFNINNLGSGAGGVNGTHPGGRTQSGGGRTYGDGTRSSYPAPLSSSTRSSGCSKSSPPRFVPPAGQSTTPSTQSSTPAASTSQITSPPASSPPPGSTTPTPGSSTPASGTSAGAPQAGVNGGNPALAGGNALTGTVASAGTTDSARRVAEGASTSASGAPSPATTGNGPLSNKTQPYPCQSSKPKHPKKSSSPSTATQTSAKLTQTRPSKAVAAKFD